jgi:hypothetical protein
MHGAGVFVRGNLDIQQLTALLLCNAFAALPREILNVVVLDLA